MIEKAADPAHQMNHWGITSVAMSLYIPYTTFQGPCLHGVIYFTCVGGFQIYFMNITLSS